MAQIISIPENKVIWVSSTGNSRIYCRLEAEISRNGNNVIAVITPILYTDNAYVYNNYTFTFSFSYGGKNYSSVWQKGSTAKWGINVLHKMPTITLTVATNNAISSDCNIVNTNDVDVDFEFSYISSPVAPSVPKNLTMPTNGTPNENFTLDWDDSTGGTNGVSGYELWLRWIKPDGSTAAQKVYTTSVSNLTLNPNSVPEANVNNGAMSPLSIAGLRSYTIVNNQKIYSDNLDWSSKHITFTYKNPSNVRNLEIEYNTNEPVVTSTYIARWDPPSDIGSADYIKNYNINWIVNNEIVSSKLLTFNEGAIPHDIITFPSSTPGLEVGNQVYCQVQAMYEKDGDFYRSNFIDSNKITFISDKFIQLSVNGSSFTKRKMYISINGSAFIEVKKEKLRVIK